jgi:uncharacterized protein YndB with AHSA1/START domain
MDSNLGKVEIDKENLTIKYSRVFNAPRELVWKVYTEKEYIPQWWGWRTSTTTVDKYDFVVGGEWRLVSVDGDATHAYKGVFKEIVPNEKFTWTFIYEPIGDDHELTESNIFEDVEGGKTKVSNISVYNTLDDLEGMVDSGFEGGANESLDRMAEILEKLK